MAITARYVKILIDKGVYLDYNGYLNIAEFKIKNSTGYNLALNKSCKCYTDGGYDGVNTYQEAVDGKIQPSNGYITSGIKGVLPYGNDWLKIDLGNIYTEIYSMELSTYYATRMAAITDYRIAISTDDISYTIVATIIGKPVPTINTCRTDVITEFLPMIESKTYPVDDANTLAMFHFDGNVNDSTGRAWTFTSVYGGAMFSTDCKVGNSSLFLDGSQYFSSSTSNSVFLNNFTMEFYMKSLTSSGNLIRTPNNYFTSYLSSSNNRLNLSFTDSTGSSSGNWGIIISDGQWHHIVLQRLDNYLYYYVDGKISNGLSHMLCKTTFETGQLRLFENFVGYIDEFRISNVARYSSDFTPSTEVFTTPTMYPHII